MDATDLESRYVGYLAALNERRFDDLGEFVHDRLTYNDEPISRQQYRENLEHDVAAIPDLVFLVGTIVVQHDTVACRLLFDCTPVAEFHGFQPDGSRISFVEHVFYRFTEGRIAHVWSLIDDNAIRAQLG